MDYSLSAALPRFPFGLGCGCSSAVDERGLSGERTRKISRALPAFDPRFQPSFKGWGMGQSVAAVAGPAGLALGATSAALGIANTINTMIETWGHNGYNNEATQVVNAAEYQMQQNLIAWNSSPKCAADQMQALANFDKLWNGVLQTCTQIAGGPSSDSAAAGTNCIQDRQANACKFKDSTGACWDWFKGYRDPIANDPAAMQTWDPLTGQILSNLQANSCSAQPATPSASSGSGSTGSTSGGSNSAGTGTTTGGATPTLWTQLTAPNIGGIPYLYIGLAGILLLVVIE